MSLGIINARRSEYNGGGDLQVSISNGHGGVALGIAEAGARITHEAVSFTPEEARAVGIALLNAALNVAEGMWMGPTDNVDRARVSLGASVEGRADAASAEAISERVVRDFAGHDETPVMALTKLMERSDFRAADILVMIRKAVRLARA